MPIHKNPPGSVSGGFNVLSIFGFFGFIFFYVSGIASFYICKCLVVLRLLSSAIVRTVYSAFICFKRSLTVFVNCHLVGTLFLFLFSYLWLFIVSSLMISLPFQRCFSLAIWTIFLPAALNNIFLTAALTFVCTSKRAHGWLFTSVLLYYLPVYWTSERSWTTEKSYSAVFTGALRHYI